LTLAVLRGNLLDTAHGEGFRDAVRPTMASPIEEPLVVPSSLAISGLQRLSLHVGVKGTALGTVRRSPLRAGRACPPILARSLLKYGCS
jgi:hypothetical protein